MDCRVARKTNKAECAQCLCRLSGLRSEGRWDGEVTPPGLCSPEQRCGGQTSLFPWAAHRAVSSWRWSGEPEYLPLFLGLPFPSSSSSPALCCVGARRAPCWDPVLLWLRLCRTCTEGQMLGGSSGWECSGCSAWSAAQQHQALQQQQAEQGLWSGVGAGQSQQ